MMCKTCQVYEKYDKHYFSSIILNFAYGVDKHFMWIKLMIIKILLSMFPMQQGKKSN